MLLYTRKICINCRCPREIHQVTSFDPLQRGFEKLSLGERQEESNLLDYVWYPQGVTNDMVITKTTISILLQTIYFICRSNDI